MSETLDRFLSDVGPPYLCYSQPSDLMNLLLTFYITPNLFIKGLEVFS